MMPIYGRRSSDFVAPPIFDVAKTRGPSLGAGLSKSFGDALAAYMQAKDEEEARRKAEEEADIIKQMEAEDRLLELAPILSMFEKGGIETPMGGEPPPPGGLPVMPEGVPETIPLGDHRLAEPLLDEITLPTGEKVSIPPIRGQRERLQAEAGAAATFEARKGTEALSPELLAMFPPEFQARWQDEQRVPSAAVDKLLMELIEEPAWKGPETIDLGDRVELHYPDGRVEIRKKRLPPQKPETKEAEWVTVTDLKTGQRVRITETEWNTAPEGTYSDIKPSVPRTTTSAAADKQLQSQVRTVLGNEGETEGDSLWALSHRLSLKGPAGIVGPAAKGIGLVGSINRALGLGSGAADINLYWSQVEGFIPLFARIVGHKGRLSDKDLARTQRLFPVVSGVGTDTREEQVRKLHRVEAFMTGEESPIGLFDPQPGIWPPPEGAGAGAPKPKGLSPGMKSLMEEYGGAAGG